MTLFSGGQAKKDFWWEEAAFKSLIDIGLALVKLLSWLNGGALFLSATFVGQHWQTATSDLIASFRTAMMEFAGGLGSIVVAVILAYVGQRYLYSVSMGGTPARWWSNHEYWLIGAMLLVLASTALFIVGSFTAIAGIT